MDTLDLEHALLSLSLGEALGLQTAQPLTEAGPLADTLPVLPDGLLGTVALTELLSGTVAGVALPLLDLGPFGGSSGLAGFGLLGSLSGDVLDLGGVLDDLVLPLLQGTVETVDGLLGLVEDGLPSALGLAEGLDGLLGDVLTGDLSGWNAAVGTLPSLLGGGLGLRPGDTLGSTLGQVELVIGQVIDQLESLLGNDLPLPAVLDDLPLDETVQAIQQILGNTLVPLVGAGVDLLQDIVTDLQTALDAGNLAALGVLTHDLVGQTVDTVQAVAGLVATEALGPGLDLAGGAIDQVHALVGDLLNPLGEALPVLAPALGQAGQVLDFASETVTGLDNTVAPVLDAVGVLLDDLVLIMDGALEVLAPALDQVDGLLAGGDLPLLGGLLGAGLGDPLTVLEDLPLLGDLLSPVGDLLAGAGLALPGAGGGGLADGLPLLGDLLGGGLGDPLALLEGLPVVGDLLAPVQDLLAGLAGSNDLGLDSLLGVATGLPAGDLLAAPVQAVLDTVGSLSSDLPLVDGLTAPLSPVLETGLLDKLLSAGGTP